MVPKVFEPSKFDCSLQVNHLNDHITDKPTCSSFNFQIWMICFIFRARKNISGKLLKLFFSVLAAIPRWYHKTGLIWYNTRRACNWIRLVLDGRNRIYHRSLMQTEKSQPEGKRIMPETRFTEFPSFSVDPRVGILRSASEADV